MKHLRSGMLSLLTIVLCSLFSMAQQNAVTATNATVPPLIPFSSVATDEGGSSLSGEVNITFSLYAAQQGGAPLWTETQNNVQLDPTGHYSVQLGITQPNGVPTTLFTTSEARWLGVRIAEQGEQPRVLLLSVPYALKAGDAATIGGLPPSAFVLAAPASGATSVSAASYTADSASAQNAPPPAGGAVTGTGTVDYLPMWDSTSDIISSVLFQSGSGTTAKIGINNATPAATLDVGGNSILRGSLSLPNAGTATAAAGKDSQPLGQAASTFNSTSGKAVTQTFEWLAEPVNNDTATASATLNLLFGSGTTKPAETGLHIASTGLINFATGQTFPGAGTITGITTAAGSGLIGGATSGTPTLSLLNTCTTKQVLQWSGTAWACASAGTGTVTSVASGAGLTGGPITGAGTLSIATGGVTNAMLATAYAQLGAANTFTANQTLNGTLTATTSNSFGLIGTTSSTASFSSGVEGSATATTGASIGVQGQSHASGGFGVYGEEWSLTGLTYGVYGQTESTAGYGVGGIVDASSGSTAGVYGQTNSPTGYGVEGLDGAPSGNGVGVYGTASSSSGYGVEGAVIAANGAGVYAANNSSTGNAFGLFAMSASANGLGVEGTAPIGVYGVDSLGDDIGVLGQTNSGAGVQGQAAAGGYAVVGLSNTGWGVYGQTQSPTNDGVLGENFATSGNAPGVYGTSASTAGYGVYGAGAYGVYGADTTATGTGNGVYGTSPNGFGVYGNSTDGTGVYGYSSGTGVWGSGTEGVLGIGGDYGVLGAGEDFSNTGGGIYEGAGLWGDTGGASGAYFGVLATADSNTALLAANTDSSGAYPAMLVENFTTQTHNPVFQTSSPNTYSGSRHCTIDTSANLTCTGVISGVVQQVDGKQTAIYAMQSAENWLEDAGSGQLANGSVRIELDSAFAQTVNAGVEYHVFLTPNGDSRGLYVSRKTATSFEVHEQGGGASSIAFDYRIMAKRKGYETVRLEDLTERFKQPAAAPQKKRPPLPSVKPRSVPAMAAPPMHPMLAPRPVPLAPKLLPTTPPRIAQASRPAVNQK